MFKKLVTEAEKITYRLTGEQQSQLLEFDTYFFDDFVRVEVYHKNSTA
jgi:hypothetical protein